MKEKVIKRFRDKNTKKVYEKGATYDGSTERIKELQDKGYLEVPKKAKEGPKKTAEK